MQTQRGINNIRYYMYVSNKYIIKMHYITLHYITLHYITLHYITLHYITLHYITLQSYIHLDIPPVITLGRTVPVAVRTSAPCLEGACDAVTRTCRAYEMERPARPAVREWRCRTANRQARKTMNDPSSSMLTPSHLRPTDRSPRHWIRRHV